MIPRPLFCVKGDCVNTAVSSKQILQSVSPVALAGPTITYNDLLKHFDEVEPDKSQSKSGGNQKSTLRQFWKSRGLTGASRVGAELGSAFETETLPQYLASKGGGRGVRNIDTDLKMWKRYYMDICVLRAQDQPAFPVFETLNEALKYCFEETKKRIKLSYASLAKATNVNISTCFTYINKLRWPDVDSFSRIERLEEFFIENLGIAKGTLTRFAPQQTKETYKSRRDRSRRKRTAAERAKEEKALKEKDFSATLGSEFAGLTDFKTRVDPSELGLMRHKTGNWNLRPGYECRRPKWQKKYFLSSDGLSYSPTASLRFSRVLGYFGTLKDLGYNPADFSLVYLVDSKIFLSAIVEMKRRNGGILTRTHQMVFQLSTALSRPQYGYVYQQPAFAAKLPCPENFTPEEWANLTPEQWKDWCEKERNKINEQLRKYEDNNEIIEGTRDSWKRIQRFIDYVDPDTGRRSPITALLDVADALAERIVYLTEQCKYHPNNFHLLVELLAHERDFFFFSLIACLPLRISMFVKMTYRERSPEMAKFYRRPDGRANLYKRADGTWAVYFHYLDFKNWRHLAKNNYDIGLPARMTPIIEHWMDIDQKLGQMLFRTNKEFFKDSDLVFEPLLHLGPNKGDKEKIVHTVSGVLTVVYQKRMYEVHGGPVVSPHSARHLVASHIVINNTTSSDRFQDAAEVLHEKVDTVKKHYARLIAEPGNQNYHSDLEKLIERRNGNG